VLHCTQEVAVVIVQLPALVLPGPHAWAMLLRITCPPLYLGTGVHLLLYAMQLLAIGAMQQASVTALASTILAAPRLASLWLPHRRYHTPQHLTQIPPVRAVHVPRWRSVRECVAGPACEAIVLSPCADGAPRRLQRQLHISHTALLHATLHGHYVAAHHLHALDAPPAHIAAQVHACTARMPAFEVGYRCCR
jgi:hypothetical protein